MRCSPTAPAAVGASVLVITGGVGLFLGVAGVPDAAALRAGASSPSPSGSPSQDVIGIAAVLVGTVSVALVAMFFAFPTSVADGAVHQRVRAGEDQVLAGRR